MSTRSIIATTVEGNIKAIYCHFDGDAVGQHLQKNYATQEAAEALIQLGDLSYIEGLTVCAYHRDKGEPWHKCQPRQLHDMESLYDYARSEYVNYLHTHNGETWNTQKIN